VWSETLIQATLEQKTASEICEYVLRHYVSLPAEERPPIRLTASSGRPRSIYIDQPVPLWHDRQPSPSLTSMGRLTISPALALLRTLCREIDGFPRHLGIHSGGMVITGAPLIGRLPTEPATMAGRVVTQWDKEALADVGLVKIDILGLRMLSAIGDAVRLVGQTTGSAPAVDGLSLADPAVYDMIAQADTVGVFQVESRAQAQMLPRLRPRCLADLIVAISLIRPGPIQGNMAHQPTCAAARGWSRSPTCTPCWNRRSERRWASFSFRSRC
jgi:hypothetical protein